MGKNKMKSNFLSIFIIMIVFSSMVLSLESKKHQNKLNKNKPDPKKYKNIHDILKNYPAAKDNRDLWKNMENNNYNSVAFNGVHGPHDYKPPTAGTSTGGFKISSPSPKRKALKGDRVIAGGLAGPKTSASVFDLPDRKNVQQIDMPVSTTKNISYHYNAQRGTKQPNMKLQLHGTESVIKPVLHGTFLEVSSSEEIKPAEKKKIIKAIEKKEAKKAKIVEAKKAEKKKMDKRVANVDEKSFKKAKDDALKIAKGVENTSGVVAKKVIVKPNKLVIPIQSAMKREKNNVMHKNKQV